MKRCSAVVAVCLAISLTVAACGSSSSSTTTTGGGSAGATTGTSSSGPKQLKAQTIGVLGVTSQSEEVLNVENAIKASNKVLGWKTVIEDGQNTPSVMNDDIQNLVNQRVSAILTIGIDANNVSQGLSAAQTAKIPVIAAANRPSPVGENMFTGIYSDDPVAIGTSLADYAIKKTPGAKAVAQQFSLVYQAAGVTDGFAKQLTAKGGTVLATQQLEGANITQSLSQTAVSLMRAQPTAQYLVSGLDFAPSVEIPALKNANITGVTVLADFDDSSTLSLIRAGDPVVVAVPNVDQGVLDALNALAAHFATGAAIPATDPAGPMQVKVVDKANVPAEGNVVFPFPPQLAAQTAKWKKEYDLP